MAATNIVSKATYEAQYRWLARFNATRKGARAEVDDRVWVETRATTKGKSRKLVSRRDGPYIVKELLSEGNKAVLVHSGNPRRRLTRHQDDLTVIVNEEVLERPDEVVEVGEAWEVEQISTNG